jgi:hypothetical protein
MLLLQFSFMSPALMLVAALLVVLIAKMRGRPIERIGRLVWTSAAFALAGAVATLVLTIAWMIWYEKTTGYSAGNGPLGWIFFYGPLGAASGQLVALLLWWFKSTASAHDIA